MLTVLFAALFAFLMGLAFCLVGYRLFLVLLPVWGFFAGFWLGAAATTWIFGGGFLATTTGLVIGFFLGLIGGLLSYLFYILGVALVAGGFGAALGSGFMLVIGFDPGFMTAIVSMSAAIMMALITLVLNLQKYVIIVLTAIGGANAIVLSGLLLMGRVSLESVKLAGNAVSPVLQDSWFWLIVWLIIAAGGIMVQIRANRSYTFTRQDFVQDWG